MSDSTHQVVINITVAGPNEAPAKLRPLVRSLENDQYIMRPAQGGFRGYIGPVVIDEELNGVLQQLLQQMRANNTRNNQRADLLESLMSKYNEPVPAMQNAAEGLATILRKQLVCPVVVEGCQHRVLLTIIYSNQMAQMVAVMKNPPRATRKGRK